MGVYMSQPCREKHSIDEEQTTLSYGASSMQGWRKTQEDDHNCCLEYDKERNMSLFAVYDGHGGAEVAVYTAQNFPEFLKTIPAFKEGRLSQALEDAFLAFDEDLIKSESLTKLKELAGCDKDEQTEEEQEEEVKGLFEEADMPLGELLQRYQAGGVKALRDLRKGELMPSPALRGKKSGENTTETNDDIKENLQEKLVNGEGDCNGDHAVSGKSTEISCKVGENSEIMGKGDIESNDSEQAAPDKLNDSKNLQNDGNEVNDEEKTSSVKSDNSEEWRQDDETKNEVIVNVNECSEAAASGPVDTKSLDCTTVHKDNSNLSETLPDSTQQQTDCTSPNKTKDSSSTPPKPKTEEANGETEVTSSSEKSLTQKQNASSGNSSSTESSGTKPSSSGESGSLSEPTSGGSSSGSGSASSYSAVADSSSKVEPCSSSGRTRSGRRNVIPEEGEDESSFDEDEETTDEDSEEDEEMYVEEDSEDDSEDEELGEGEDMEEVEGEEDDGVRYSMEPGYDSGCTAVVALVRGRELFVSNAGDSRCVVCREGKAVDMSFDHKPEDEVELKRILNAGGQVTPDGRVNGGLNLSRAIGDHAYKKNSSLPLKDQMITALPDVRCITLDQKDEFMVLACDGIWNSLSSQETVTFIKDRLATGVTNLSTICEDLFECCLAPNTNGDGSGCDNMTCIIVKFKEEMWKLDGSSVKRRASSEADSSQTDTKKAKEGD